MDSNAKQEFLSLKWKLFRLLAVVFFFIALGVSWAANSQQENQLKFEQQRLQQQSERELNGQIRQIQDTLIQQAEYLALLGERDLSSLSLKQLVDGIKKTSSKLMLSSSIDDIEVFGPGNNNIYSGVNSDIQLSAVSQQAQSQESPVVDFSCYQECSISAAIPVLLDEGVGTVAVETSIADVVLRVNQSSGWDIGVLIEHRSQQRPDISS